MHRQLLVSLLASLPSASVMAQFAVATTAPVRHGTMGPMEPVRVTFNAAVDPTSVTAHAFAVFGRWSGPASGAIRVAPDLRTIVFQPLRPLFAGEPVVVTLARTIRSSTGQSLPAGYTLQVAVASARGSRQFQHVQTIPQRLPGEGLVGTYGIFAGDVDRDGAPDITSMNEVANDIRVLRNSGCGQFSAPVPIDNPGQWPSPNDSGDFDRNGWIDLATGNQNGGAISVYLNQGGTFAPPVVHASAGYVHGVAAADFDGDGYWDIAAPNGSAVSVFINQGNGTFAAPVDYDAGGNGEDNVGIGDVDEDGVPDLMVGNLFSGNMGVLIGQGDGTFALTGTFPTGGQPFHEAVADCNGDGHTDIAFANRGTNTLAVLFGDGTGHFSAPATDPVGMTPAAIDLADLDADGAVDCVVSNYGSGNYSVLWNQGDGTFLPAVTLAGVQSGSCCTIVDFDRDGVLDLIGADENADVAILYRQTVPSTGLVQAPGCNATLRINQRADGPGFGRPSLPLARGQLAAIGLSGQPSAGCVLVLGTAMPAGVPFSNWGLLNLDPAQTLTAQFELLDGNGERLLLADIAPSLAPGLRFALQAVFLDGAIRLSNPVEAITLP